MQNEASAFRSLPNIGTLFIASSGMQLKSNVPGIKLPVGGIRPGHTTSPVSYGNNIASLPLTRSQGQPIVESLPRTSSQKASNAQSVQSASGQGHSTIKYVPLSRSQGQPYVPKQIQIQGFMPLKMDCKYTQQIKEHTTLRLKMLKVKTKKFICRFHQM